MIHLDTSFLIHALRPGSPQERTLLGWLNDSEQIGVSAFAWAEFLCGPVSDEATASALELLGEPVPVDRAIARLAADLFNASGRLRGSLGDCLIAAAAIDADARLATDNPRDYQRLRSAGLVLA